MTTAEIIDRLRALGVEMRAEGRALLIEAPSQPPAEALALVQELRERKVQALAVLQGWDARRAGELLLGIQARLLALLGDRPVPEMGHMVSAAYDRLVEAHDRRDWQTFVQAAADFEAAWKKLI